MQGTDTVEIENDKPANYKQFDGRKIRMYNEIVLIKSAEETEYMTIEKKATPKKNGRHVTDREDQNDDRQVLVRKL